MSNIPREQAQFRRGKSPIIAKYADDHQTLMSAIAGRGFSKMPGYAYDAENRIELAAKMGLSDLNYKILSETIERELKQSGIDYDQAYKAAAIAWELEKQSLMAAWDAELAGIKRGMSAEEETLNLLAIEVSKRAIALMEAKTVIDLAMEAHRTTLAGLDGTVAPYEVSLANAKLLTAQKKLELIPIFQEILAKEQELLIIEQSKAAAYASLIAAEGEISAKKETLKPFLNELAAKTEALAAKITTDQIPKEEQIAGEKIAQAQAAVDKSGYQVQEITAEIETETKRLELYAGKRDLSDTKFGYEQGLVTHEKALTDEYQNNVKADFAVGLATERAANTEVIDDKSTAEATRNTTKLASANTLSSAEIAADRSATNYRANSKGQIAEIQAAAQLTASLKHIIG